MNSDVRIIAATNADLTSLVQNGSFRKDLYYRLNIFPIEIPLLKERLEDLTNLTDIFLKKLNAKYGKGITGLHPSVIEGFQQYEWPGNIRELENILERAYILETSSILSAQNFPPEMVKQSETYPLSERNPSSLARARQIAVEAFEKSYLTALLGQTKGKINLAAQKADITTRQLNRLITRYGLNKKNFKR
jgi:transcriptional regulator with PAS, ATPase and Fis domain